MTDAALTALLPVKTFHPRYLREAVDSVVHQTSGAWQLLIVIEPSIETGVKQLLGHYLQDDRIRLILNEGRGLGGAFNTGLRKARTEFVAILLGDDLWAPDAVEVLARHIRSHPEVHFFHSSRRIIDEQGEPISSVHLSRTRFSVEDFREGSPVKHLLCWKRSEALAIGGMDERFGPVGVDDLDFPWSMAERGAVFHAVPECLYVYRDHRSAFRLTTHVPLSVQTREVWRIMRKHGVGRIYAARRLWHMRRGHLRQCLYRSEWERRLRVATGRPPRPWRESYD